MTVPFVHVRAGARMPAKMIADRAAFRALDRGDGVDERIVVDVRVRAVEDAHAFVAIDEDVAGDCHALRNFKEETVDAALNPVVDEHAVDIADVVPNAVRVRLIDDEIVAAGDAIGLVEDLYG